MRHAVSEFLKQCPTCQEVKGPSRKVGKLSPIQVKEPFELVGWDITGPFPTSKTGNKYILVMTEYLTRWCEAIALPDVTTVTIAQALLKKIILQHSCLKQILSDQRKQFRSEVLEALTKQLGITQLFSSPYHPQTNGFIERLNRTIKQIIATFVDPLHEEWDSILPFAVHAYNTSVQASTRISPFRALYGRDPTFPPDIKTENSSIAHKDAAEWWPNMQQHLPLLRHTISLNLQTAQERQKRIYDEGRTQESYQIGDLVFLYYPIPRQGLSESLLHRWIGPYTVIDRIKENTYKLRRLNTGSTTSTR